MTRKRKSDGARRRVAAKWIRNPSDRLAIDAGCYFDAAAGQRVCDFVERFCRQSKGRWAGKPLVLLDWQRDFLMRLFGWRRADGTRRFRWCYLEIAKKNGKSTLLAALCLFLIVADGEGGAEVHINAFTRNQAAIVFSEAARMVKRSPALKARLDVLRTVHRIIDARTDSFVVANSADADANDGPNASAVIFDELHRQRDRTLWEVFEYAGVSRDQPLHIAATTAGADASGVWYEQRHKAEQVNAGLVPDWEFFGVVYRADPTDKLDDRATWLKANPSLGATLRYDDFASELASAKLLPSTLAYFKRVRLGIVGGSIEKFIPPGVWDRLRGVVLPGPKAPCFLGLDMSSKLDLTALVKFFPMERNRWGVKADFFLPEEGLAQKEQRDGAAYRFWADAGYLTVCPGEEVDYDIVTRAIEAACANYDVRALGCDRMFAGQLMQEVKKSGVTVVPVGQGFYSMALPMRELEALIAGSRLVHDGNPVLALCASNVRVEKDGAGNMKPSKSKSTGRIDGIAALADAIFAELHVRQSRALSTSIYERRGLLLT